MLADLPEHVGRDPLPADLGSAKHYANAEVVWWCGERAKIRRTPSSAIARANWVAPSRPARCWAGAPEDGVAVGVQGERDA